MTEDSEQRAKVFWAYNTEGDLLPTAVYQGEQFYFQTRYAGPLVDADGTHKEFWQVYVQLHDDLYINCVNHFKDQHWFERPVDMAAVEATIEACWEHRRERGISHPAGEEFQEWMKQTLSKKEEQMKKVTKAAKESGDSDIVDKDATVKILGEVTAMSRAGSDDIESVVKKVIRKQNIPHTVDMTVKVPVDEIVDKLIDALSQDQLIAMICAIDSTMGDFDFSIQLVKELRKDLSTEIEYEEKIKSAYDFLYHTMEPEELYQLSILLMRDR